MALSGSMSLLVRRTARSSASKCFDKFTTLLYFQDFVKKINISCDDEKSSSNCRNACVFFEGFSPHSYHAIPLEIELSWHRSLPGDTWRKMMWGCAADTLFTIKTAKNIPFGHTHTYISLIRE